MTDGKRNGWNTSYPVTCQKVENEFLCSVPGQRHRQVFSIGAVAVQLQCFSCIQNTATVPILKSFGLFPHFSPVNQQSGSGPTQLNHKLQYVQLTYAQFMHLICTAVTAPFVKPEKLVADNLKPWFWGLENVQVMWVFRVMQTRVGGCTLDLVTSNNSILNSTQPEITDAGVWHLYVRIINNKTIL